MNTSTNLVRTTSDVITLNLDSCSVSPPIFSIQLSLWDIHYRLKDALSALEKGD
jgi:hypothetical protein